MEVEDEAESAEEIAAEDDFSAEADDAEGLFTDAEAADFEAQNEKAVVESIAGYCSLCISRSMHPEADTRGCLINTYLVYPRFAAANLRYTDYVLIRNPRESASRCIRRLCISKNILHSILLQPSHSELQSPLPLHL